ncbi:MAG TPA: hypothetical protein VN903_08675 [Polyangia bacterium]|nr:hypothetical protein [Polyangia bacterium]
MRSGSLALLLIGACAAGACTDFQNPTTVVDLRMLAVKTDPSEIILSADLSNPLMPIVDPASNPEVTVTPLIVDPSGGGRMVSYSISACPNDPFAPAPPGGGQGGGAFPSGGARTTVGSALCDENSDTTWVLEPGSIDMNLPTKVHPDIEQLKTAFMRDIFPDQYGNLHGGFDLGMPLTLDIKVDTEDGEQIRGVKRVLYWAQRIDDQQIPNQIPTIDELDLFYERDPATFDPVDTPQIVTSPDPNKPDQPFVVDRPGTKFWIRPSKGNAESFETTVIDPDTHHAVPFTVARETLRYRFFATAGTFAPPVTSSEPDTGFVATGPIHIESEYSPPGPGTIATDADGRATITIWVVVRDDRGGESWATRKLLITP